MFHLVEYRRVDYALIENRDLHETMQDAWDRGRFAMQKNSDR